MATPSLDMLCAWWVSAQQLPTYKERILQCLLFLSTIICIYYIIYPSYISPLAKIPNAHPLSPLTQLWIDWKRYSGREIQTIHEAFQKKGPFVRLGPNEVAVNTISNGVTTAHGHGWENFDKTQWYDFFINHG